MTEKSITIIERACKGGITNTVVFFLVDTFAPGARSRLDQILSKRAFGNLFFRQFFFLLDTADYSRFLQSVIFLRKNLDQIVSLLEEYHYEMVFRDYTDEGIIFRHEIYAILEQNRHFMNRFHLVFERSHASIHEIDLFQLNNGEKIERVFLQTEVYDTTSDCQTGINNLSFSIKIDQALVQTVRFYVGENIIFIADIQQGNGVKDLFSFVLKQHRITLYLLSLFAERLGIHRFQCFSNTGHPCRHHTAHAGFRGNYDNICTSIGMEISEWGFYERNQAFPEIAINPFIKNTIDFSFPELCKQLSI